MLPDAFVEGCTIQEKCICMQIEVDITLQGGRHCSVNAVLLNRTHVCCTMIVSDDLSRLILNVFGILETIE